MVCVLGVGGRGLAEGVHCKLVYALNLIWLISVQHSQLTSYLSSRIFLS
jgi:hypothetical protein